MKAELKDFGKRIVEGNALRIDFVMNVGFYALIVAVILSSWFGSFVLMQMFIGPALVFTLYQGMKLGIKEGRKYLHDEVVKSVVEIVDKMKNGP